MKTAFLCYIPLKAGETMKLFKNLQNWKAGISAIGFSVGFAAFLSSFLFLFDFPCIWVFFGSISLVVLAGSFLGMDNSPEGSEPQGTGTRCALRKPEVTPVE